MAKNLFAVFIMVLISSLAFGTALADSNDTNLVTFDSALNVTFPENTTFATTTTIGLDSTTTTFILYLFLLFISIGWLICSFATNSFAMGLGAGVFGIFTGWLWLISTISLDSSIKTALSITLILVSILALWNIVDEMRRKKN